MQTIVYLDTQYGYKTIDVRNAASLQEQQRKLSLKGKYVVCVIDVNRNVLTQKCDCYESHAKFIECCYHLHQENLPS